MSEVHYKCYLETGDKNITQVNVFSPKELTVEEISTQSVERAKELAQELGKTVIKEEIVPLGYRKGWF